MPAVTSQRARRRRPAASREPAASLPVARVCVETPLPHLDRAFEYLVPAEFADTAVVGARVRVRFAGKLTGGYLLDRAAVAEHTGRLAYLERIVSPEPVLSPDLLALARKLADRHAGTLADVLRLAIPPRHADVEKRAATPAVACDGPTAAERVREATVWSEYATGQSFLTALADGRSPRAVWQAMAGEDWPRRIAEALAVTVAAGRGAVCVVPDVRDLARLDAALTAELGADHFVALSASVGPRERYRRWLAARRGQVRCVIGTRAAAFAPLDDVGLVVIWDDGDDLYAEPRAPYPHTREICLVRTELAGAGLLIGGFSQTPEAQQLVSSGWAKPLQAARDAVRARAPRMVALGEELQRGDGAVASARLPTVGWQAARAAIAADTPVLVQVPRLGYAPAVACRGCRARARCTSCAGPLRLSAAQAAPGCGWCGRLAGDWRCPECGNRQLRATIVGSKRTAEELARAFPNIPVWTSSGDSVLAEAESKAALVVATPGAEPVVDGGYGAALLLDTWALLSRPDLRAGQETLRRWINAAALVRPASAGGQVVVLAERTLPVVQALLRWDPGWFAERELGERAALRFPPAVRMAKLTGTPEAIAEMLDGVTLPDVAEVLGPVPVADYRNAKDEVPHEQALIRVPRRFGGELAAGLHAALGVRSARKAPDPVRVELDPQSLG